MLRNINCLERLNLQLTIIIGSTEKENEKALRPHLIDTDF
jgi:hypothetical protein